LPWFVIDTPGLSLAFRGSSTFLVGAALPL
jgi:hypothetical protein